MPRLTGLGNMSLTGIGISVEPLDLPCGKTVVERVESCPYVCRAHAARLQQDKAFAVIAEIFSVLLLFCFEIHGSVFYKLFSVCFVQGY